METQIRTKFAAIDAKPDAAISNRLHTARLFRDGTRARHAEMLKIYRDAQERLAAYPTPNRSIADRLLGRQPDMTGMVTLERQVAVARDGLIAAEKMAASGDANLYRVEKAEAADRAERGAQLEMQRRAGVDLLAEITTARRIVSAFPAIVYSGPAFVAWTGRRIERKRKGPRNPQAKTIWGIPLDFG